MIIAENHIVTANYVLKNAKGEILDESTAQDPMEYLHGAGDVAVGLEKALEGKVVGNKIDVTLSPEEGYGEFKETLLKEVNTEMFSDIENLEVGMVFDIEDDLGEIRDYEIVDINGEKVTIDGNHPLAGETLVFDIEITAIRIATAEEIEHGHAHSEGGCGA